MRRESSVVAAKNKHRLRHGENFDCALRGGHPSDLMYVRPSAPQGQTAPRSVQQSPDV